MTDSRDSVLQLDDAQLTEFDQEYVTGPLWDDVRRLIGERFSDTEFSILDVGGGNGRFLDAVLDDFPAATAVLLDNAQVLLERNRQHPRKQLVCASVTDLRSVVGERRYDLVCLHFVLHHFILDSYSSSRRLQQAVLRDVCACLSPRGRVSVFEDLYDGAVINRLPSRVIFELTTLRRLAPLIRRLGANTAGCGICFLSERDWRETFSSAGLRLEHWERYPDTIIVSLLTRVALQLSSPQMGHFWLSSADGA